MNLYDPNRDVIRQGKHYTNHVMAMTAEKLHSKADIAQELAHRDIAIEQMLAVIEFCCDFETQEPIYFLNHWRDGEWDICREWNPPETVFPLKERRELAR